MVNRMLSRTLNIEKLDGLTGQEAESSSHFLETTIINNKQSFLKTFPYACKVINTDAYLPL